MAVLRPLAEVLKTHLAGCNIQSLHIGNRGKINENNILKAVRLPALLLKLVFLVRKYGFDIIHINPSLNKKSLIRDGLILACLRLMRFRRVLVYFHGWDKEMENRDPASSAWMRRMFIFLLNGASRIMVLAPEFQKSLIELGVDGAHIACTSMLFDESLLSNAKCLAPSTRDILFMSRFDARKGIYELLAAFGRIAAEFPETRLVFAGDGEEAPHLQARSAALGLGDRIIFPGYVRDKEKAKWLKGCAVFALPTYFPEGMPVALLEAMAAGKPLLTAKLAVWNTVISSTNLNTGIVSQRLRSH